MKQQDIKQKINTSINPLNKLFRWGPIDGRPIYALYWLNAFPVFNKLFKSGWPEMILYFQNEKFWVIMDFKKLYENGEAIFKENILHDKLFKVNIKKWHDIISEFIQFKNSIESEISDANFVDLIKRWNKFYSNKFWNVGSIPEISNWGGEQLLDREVRKKIITEYDYNYIMESLTAPEDYSFYQLEEIDLFCLKKIRDKQRLAKKLFVHQEKYFWILNSYHHTKILPVKYFKKRLDAISEKEANEKIKNIKKFKKNSIELKLDTIKKYKLPKEILKISRRLSYSILWQDFRKAYIFQANHLIDILLKKASRYYNIDFNDLHYYFIDELDRLVDSGVKVRQSEISKRKKYFFIFFDLQTGKISNYLGKHGKQIAYAYISQKIDKKISEIKGIVVNRGCIQGQVKVLLSPRDTGKLKKGEILVAPMTSPEYIIALRKAGAVITDEGGLTCHAAIVSRELGIPGIVATKIATKALNDGDIVEVDANKGIIKILKRN